MPRTFALAVLLSVAALAACGSRPEPVGAVALDRSELVLPHGAWESVTLDWRMSEPLAGQEGEPRVLLHLVDGSGELVRTFDHPLPGGWQPGETRSYRVPIYQSALGTPLAPGRYDLEVGLYDGSDRRWPVASGDEVGARSTPAAVVRAIEAPAGFPEFSFSAGWMPVETGVDLQILARRWLAGDGAVRIRGVDAPGALWLRVGIPDASPMQAMRLAEGAAQPAVRLSADCSGFEAELGGVGSHTLEVPLAPGGENPGECRVTFRANFELVSKDNDEKRTVALENLAWSRR